ncbi:uncharacterized protein [Aristolochia californica]|uniref:uncharacterized protein n=1 Tax=Aristolochia californica TaxID=171875 RepID=UPI0035DFB990
MESESKRREGGTETREGVWERGQVQEKTERRRLEKRGSRDKGHRGESERREGPETSGALGDERGGEGEREKNENEKREREKRVRGKRGEKNKRRGFEPPRVSFIRMIGKRGRIPDSIIYNVEIMFQFISSIQMS